MKENAPSKFNFTVQALIETLKSFPSDLPVIVSGYENGYENFYQPYVMKVKHEPENMYFEGEFQSADEKGDRRFVRQRKKYNNRTSIKYILIQRIDRKISMSGFPIYCC